MTFESNNLTSSAWELDNLPYHFTCSFTWRELEQLKWQIMHGHIKKEFGEVLLEAIYNAVQSKKELES